MGRLNVGINIRAVNRPAILTSDVDHQSAVAFAAAISTRWLSVRSKRSLVRFWSRVREIFR